MEKGSKTKMNRKSRRGIKTPDKNALETLIAGVQDIVFNLSLHMLAHYQPSFEYYGNAPGSVQTAPFPHTQKNGRFFRGIFQRIRQRQM